MKAIPLSRGYGTVVDDEDHGRLAQHKWSAFVVESGRKVYAVRREGRRFIYMHREIVGASQGQGVDHRDGDGLNNLRSNLRFANQSQNMANRGAQANNTSGYKGVYWHKPRAKWKAQITVNKITKHLGYFADSAEAAEAYDQAARQAWGSFALPNFPDNAMAAY